MTTPLTEDSVREPCGMTTTAYGEIPPELIVLGEETLIMPSTVR